MEPLVSVVISTYNRKDCLVKAIDGALRQTYVPMEIIVVDDGSTDGTDVRVRPMIQQYPNIIFVKNESNLGFVKNLNKGVGLAKGKYIARLDDDDIWIDPNKIAKQVDFLERHGDCVLTGGGVIKIDHEGREMIRYLLLEQDRDIRKVLLVDNVFAHSSVVFKKETWQKAGGYQEQFGFFADWALWLELGKYGTLYNFQEFFIKYLDQEENKPNSTRDVQIRRKLLAKITLNRKYRREYAGSVKALLLAFASYGYSFIPFRKKLWPALFYARTLVFGSPPYKYF